MAGSAALSVLCNGRFLGRPPSGVDRVAIEVLSALPRVAPDLAPVEFAVPAATSVALPKPLAGAKLLPGGRREGHLWEQLELPRIAGGRPLVNMCTTGPALRENQLVMIHDAATRANPANFSLAFRSWYRVLIGSLMRRARVIVTPSRFSADELTRYFGRRARGIEVIHNAGEQILRSPADASILDRLGLRDRRYVLAVGNRSPNKNFHGVLQALRMVDDGNLLLVAAGGGNSRVFAGASVEDPRLVTTGHVGDAELRALYENALCFAFPSFYEGFGIPPIEAMCCGCPSIVARSSSLPEVCGDAARYCDPHDPATLAEEIRRIAGSEALRSELREAGLAQAARYSWNRSAGALADVLRARFP